MREAKIAANLNHPNITAIYEVGQHEGKLYITMQFVDGTTTNKTPLSLREAAAVIRDAALAVDYAHARDIIHRDIKPHNIMVTQERSGTSPSEMSRRTFVMDFGLARTASKGHTLTTEGQVMGTPAYMSPEQAEGRPCDARSDVYSLGATLYTLVTQRAPFEANTPVQVLMKVTQGSPTPPSRHNPDVDPNLEAIILKAMDVNLEKRYPTAARLAAELARWLQGETPDAGVTRHLSAESRTAYLPTQKTSTVPRKSRAGAFAAVIALLVAAGGAVAWQQVFKQNPAVPPPPMNGRTEGTAHVPPPPPPPAPVELISIKTEPPGAHIRFSGVEKEWTTPATLTSRDLPYGTYTLDLFLPGYLGKSDTVALREGQPKLTIERKLDPTPRELALIVESEPSKAEVNLNGADTGKSTPYELYRDEIKERVAVIVLELPGYKAQHRSFPLDAKDVRREKIIMEPLAGRLRVRGAPPRSTLHLFAVSPGLKDPRTVLGLWSENLEALEQALDKLHPDDARHAVDRLQELARRSEARIRERALKRTATQPADPQVKPEQSLQAEPDGTVRIANAWVNRRYRLLGTSPSTLDFVSDEIRPEEDAEKLVLAEMAALVSLSAQPRPAVGRFEVTGPSGSGAGTLLPDGKPLKLPAGKATLRFLPPANDPLLREFTVTALVTDRFEFTGNLHYHSALAAEKDGDLEMAVGGFTKVLEEKTWPASEDADRGRLPEKIRALYRTWIESAEKQAKPVAGDVARAVEEAKRKIPPEAIPRLIDAWAARSGTPATRSSAAAALAHHLVRLRRPYEAMEWLERSVREGVDPGTEIEAAVAGAAADYPGLSARATAVKRSLAPIRQAAQRKAAWLGLETVEVAGKGLRVEGIAKGSPAETADLRLGDLLTEMGTAALRAPVDLAAALQAAAEGDEAEIKFDRGAEKRSVRVRFGAKPEKDPEMVRAPETAGTISSVHPQYGIFVSLEPNAVVEKGDLLEVLRGTEVVGEVQVVKIAAPDSRYPNGSASCTAVRGNVGPKDKVRRVKR